MINNTNGGWNNITSPDPVLLNKAVGGLLLFITSCIFMLIGLLLILFRPCSVNKCKGCTFCSILVQYVFLKFYKLCCCKCCKKGQSYIVLKASNLQQEMEVELEQWHNESDEEEHE